MSHSASVPPKVATYFGISTHPPIAEHPLIAQVFTPGKGWRKYPHKKRVSLNVVRELRRKGATSVALQHGTRVADFQIHEVVR